MTARPILQQTGSDSKSAAASLYNAIFKYCYPMWEKGGNHFPLLFRALCTVLRTDNLRQIPIQACIMSNYILKSSYKTVVLRN